MVQPFNLDPDKPIPYVLTDKGRADLAAALLEDLQHECSHRFLKIRGVVVCQECGMDLARSLDHRYEVFRKNGC